MSMGSQIHIFCAVAVVFSTVVASRVSEPLRVEAKVDPGPYFVGQGIELRVRVVGRGRRPEISIPAIPDASAWTIGTEVRPISRSEIGSIVAEENLLETRIRVVARRPGKLQIPSIPVRLDGRSGRSRGVHVEILGVPAIGRPSAFLGGVGGFSLHAGVLPDVVRVGQEFEFRVKVTGPAAWGMSERPELLRYDRLPLGLRIRAGPIESKDEPPERTFVYRLRPSRAGEEVLPPISIASFDPSLSRYMTQVTQGVPIRVVAVAAFDPAAIVAAASMPGADRSIVMRWTVWSIAAIALAIASGSLVVVRRRLRSRPLTGQAAARRFAARLARSLASGDGADWVSLGAPVTEGDTLEGPGRLAARGISGLLIRYLEVGAARPPGALTPEEASRGVAQVSRSDQLGQQAGRLTAKCDLVLYGNRQAESLSPGIMGEARALFEALGRSKTTSSRGAG
jgi:hypothetical protein